MSPFRWDVLLVGFVLSLPVLALGLRGDLPAEDVAMRLLWCLAAGWGAVALLRLAFTPLSYADDGKASAKGADTTEGERSPAV
jgi:hypothetical protein